MIQNKSHAFRNFENPRATVYDSKLRALLLFNMAKDFTLSLRFSKAHHPFV